VNKFPYVRNWPSKLTASLITYYSDVNNDYLLFADRNIYCNELFKAIKSLNVIVNTYLRHRKVSLRRKFCVSLRPYLRWSHVRQRFATFHE